jgi:hypothetical protein
MSKIPTEDFAQRQNLDGTEIIFSQNAQHSPPEQKFTIQQVLAYFSQNGTPASLRSIQTIVQNYTATAADYTLLLDATTASFELKLPAADLHTGRMYRLVSVFANPSNAVTLSADKGSLVQGQTSTPSTVISTAPDVRIFQSDGTDWILVGRY